MGNFTLKLWEKFAYKSGEKRPNMGLRGSLRHSQMSFLNIDSIDDDHQQFSPTSLATFFAKDKQSPV